MVTIYLALTLETQTESTPLRLRAQTLSQNVVLKSDTHFY